MIISNLRNPRFAAKGWYILFLPLTLLSHKKKSSIVKFAQNNWDKYPTVMHRLSWTCKKLK